MSDQTTDQTDHYLHEVNALANEGMRAAMAWLDSDGYRFSADTYIRRRSKVVEREAAFLALLAEYEELTKDGEK